MKLATQHGNEKVLEDKNFWTIHFQEFQQSGLSKSEYARKNQLVLNRFFYWCYKFEKDMGKGKVKSKQSGKSDFVAIKISRDKPMQSKPNTDVICTVDLGNSK